VAPSRPGRSVRSARVGGPDGLALACRRDVGGPAEAAGRRG
jgi:hypothetical protein